MRLQVLGPVRAWRGDTELDLGSPQQRGVLGLLALALGRPVSRAELVDTLWFDNPPASATNVIQTYVKHLRHLLDPQRRPRGPSAVLPSVGDGYALHLEGDAIDLRRFRELLAEAGRARQEGDDRGAADRLEQALSLWHGPPLADVPALANHPKVVALLGERRMAMARYGEAMIAAGSAAEALPALAEAAAAQPLDEAAQARLVLAYQASGQPARAFETYDLARRRLAEELGVDPGPHLAAAHLALLSPPGVGPAAEPPDPVAVRPKPAQLPADVYAFTGREPEMSQLDDLLDNVDDPSPGTAAVVISALSGTAGVGKTAVAVHWAHRVRDRFTDGQLYVDLRGHDPQAPVNPGDALARLLAALGVDGDEIPLDLDDRAARYRTELSGRRMLIVLDNAASVEQTRPLLPGTRSCVVVVTSRDSLGGLVALQGARRLDVDLLPLSDAVTLLGLLIGARVADEPEAAAALAEQCARLPLALRVAAELAASRPEIPLAGLVAELADRQRRLERLDVGDARAAVRTVFSWSYERLPPDAARAFRWMGLHPGPDLDAYALAALAQVDLDAAQQLAARLIRTHLVQPAEGRLGMHDLLRAYATDLAQRQDDEASRRAAQTRLFDYYLAGSAAAMAVLHPADRRPGPVQSTGLPVPPMTDAATARAWLDRERAVLTDLCGYGVTHGFQRHVIQIAATLYRYLEGGYQVEALTLHTQALDAARQLGDRTAQAGALTSLGAVARLLSRYTAAAEQLADALTLYRDAEKTPEARHGEARALTNLGIVDERLGRHDSAAEHHQQALELYRQTGDRYGEAAALNNLGGVYSQGRFEVAEQTYEQALALYRELGEGLGEAIALSNLGIVRSSLGRHELALEHHQRALALFRGLNYRYGEAAVLNNIGDVDMLLGRYPSAIAHQRQALDLFTELGHRYGEAAAHNGLGEALLGAGRPAEAITHHTTALTIAAETGDRDEQARAHRGAGRGHRAAGDLAQAREHWERALALFTELGVPDADELRTELAQLAAPAQRPPGPTN